MTTKKGAAAIASSRHVVIRWWSFNCQWKLKLLLFLCVALTFFALFTFHSRHSPPDISSSSRHRLRVQFHGVPKIAFLFLARRNLPLDFLWDSFFEVAFLFILFVLSYFMNEWIFLCLTLGSALWKIHRMLTWRTSRSMFTRLPGSPSMSPHRGPLSFAIDNWRIAFRSFFIFLNFILFNFF